MIAEHFTVFEKMGDTIPMSEFNSLERKNNPCKVIALNLTLSEKMRDPLSFLVFISLERKNDPCKSDGLTFYPF